MATGGCHSAMDKREGEKRRRLEDQGGGGRRRQNEGERVVDINSLPDAVLGEIVSRLPTKDGARTQLLSRMWRPVWCSAPLNLNASVSDWPKKRIPVGDISRILSAHPGPGRRFSIPEGYLYGVDRPTATLDGWLQSPALDNLRELEINVGNWSRPPPLTLSALALRFSSTLRMATFCFCTFLDGDSGMGMAPQLPLLEKLSLLDVTILESFLHALLTGCSAMEALVLCRVRGCSRAWIVSSSLRSITVSLSHEWLRLHHLTIQDAPCLERKASTFW
ncbi:hypothetical protein ACP4OV_002299 [Aristida adscensionis]